MTNTYGALVKLSQKFDWLFGTAKPIPREQRQNENGYNYVRSYLHQRRAVGVIGVAMPVILHLFVDEVEGAEAARQSSFSAYYWTSGRDIFVGSLCAMGVFLAAYKWNEQNEVEQKYSREFVMSTVGGFAAIAVALFPTAQPEGSGIEYTAWQEWVGPSLTNQIHFGSALVFIMCLALLAFAFAEGDYAAERFGDARLHFAMGSTIVMALVAFGVSMAVSGPDRALYWTEFICTLAFSVSWFHKGSGPAKPEM